MKTRGVLLLTSTLWLVTLALSSSLLSHDSFLPGGAVSLLMSSASHGRSLLDDINSYALSATLQYLIPSAEPDICTGSGASCCQQDDYATPFRVRMQNSSTAVISGRSYTTFFMALTHSGMCDSTLDAAGCCGGSVSTIWMDVDPALVVRYVSFNGHATGVTAEQGNNGLSISGFSVGPLGFPGAGYPLTVTVEGVAADLCPLSEMAPVPGYCSTILGGASSSGVSGACCPRSVSQASPAGSVFLPPADGGFQCSSDIAKSAYSLALLSVGVPYFLDGAPYVTYNFLLRGTSSCDAAAVGACCSMPLDGLELKVASQVVVDTVTIGTLAVSFSTSPWSEAGTSSADYQALLLNDLGLAPSDVPAAGLPIVLTVALTDSYAPDLCNAMADGSEATLGACQYFLYADTESLCCPASATVAVPAPAAICNPTLQVPVSQTSVSLQYYEHTYATDGSSTAFTFLVADHNTGATSCGEAHCGNVCGWSLFTTVPAQQLITVMPDASSDAVGPYSLPVTPAATIAFAYGPSGEATVTYTITMPGHRSLSDLCSSGAVDGQGANTCAAIIRTPDFFSIVYFSETDLALPSYPPPPLPQNLCAGTPMPLSSACTRVDTAGYNSPANGLTTVIDFKIVNHEDEAAPCLADGAVPSPTFTIMLQPAVASALAASRAVSLQPSTAVVSTAQGSVQWSWTPTAQNGSNVMHYSLNVPIGGLTLATACRQGLFFDQPEGSCVVQISGSTYCFRGYISAGRAPALVWLSTASPSSSSSSTSQSGAIIGGVLGGFFGLLVILAVAAALVFAITRRRRARTLQFSNLRASGGVANSSNGGVSTDLQRPLATSERSSSGSGAGLLRTASRGLLGSFTAPAAASAQQSRDQSFSNLAAAVAAHRAALSNGGNSSDGGLSSSSATPSDIAIQVRRGTLSDAGAPLQPVAPEGVMVRMRSDNGNNLLSGEVSDCSYAPNPPPTSHYRVPDDGSLL